MCVCGGVVEVGIISAVLLFIGRQFNKLRRKNVEKTGPCDARVRTIES